MVERNKAHLDKMKSQREKKIKKIVGNKQANRMKQDLRDLAKGRISPEDFDEDFGGETQ